MSFSKYSLDCPVICKDEIIVCRDFNKSTSSIDGGATLMTIFALKTSSLLFIICAPTSLNSSSLKCADFPAFDSTNTLCPLATNKPTACGTNGTLFSWYDVSRGMPMVKLLLSLFTSRTSSWGISFSAFENLINSFCSVFIN